MTFASGRLVLRVAVSLTLMVVLAIVLDTREVLARLSELRPGWIGAALAVSVLQVVASAWRWRFTASRLGIPFPLQTAVTEYYLAIFLNQVLPGGVLGDVSRAWRHARGANGPDDDGARRLRSVHAVILERTSGQAVMTALAAVSAAVILSPRTAATRALLPANPLSDVPMPVSVVLVVAGILLGVSLLRLLVRRIMRLPALSSFLADARRALLGSALPVQAGASLLIVGSYVAVFVLVARAVGVTTPVGVLAPLVPPILVTMLVPVSIAGWGVRESAAAVLWGAVGLTAADGVAISVAYGLLVLVSSLPGALLLVTLRVGRERDRRGGRSPA